MRFVRSISRKTNVRLLLVALCRGSHCIPSVFNSHRPYYGLPEDFAVEQLLTRTKTGRKRNIYFTSKLVKEVTLRNDHLLKVRSVLLKVR